MCCTYGLNSACAPNHIFFASNTHIIILKDFSRKRHFAKALTWRFIGTLDTIFLSWLVTGNPFIGLQIGGAEIVTKMFLYYVHERLWFKIPFGSGSKKSSQRHLLKTISWRILGTIDTMILAWIISGNPMTGLKVGVIEVFTKMLLYYLHERFWYKLDYGVENRRKTKYTNDE